VETVGAFHKVTAAPLGRSGFFRLRQGFGSASRLDAINTDWRDRGPSLSSDGLSLVFCSDRDGHFDLMMSSRASPTAPWGPPVNLTSVNTPGDEAFPSLSADGLSLFFADQFSIASTRPGNMGQADIWVSTRANPQAPWQPPVNLGPAVNSAFFESSPTISNDGRTLVFCSLDRPGHGGADLWMSTRADPNDPLGWTPAVNLGAVINSSYADCCADLSPDGLVLYFSSGRPVSGRPAGVNHIWVSRRTSLSEPFGAPVSLASSFPDFHTMFDPCLSQDGATLFFNSTGYLSSPVAFGDLWSAPVFLPPPLSISQIAAPTR
jgi:Tol biopolymer transport system component